MKTPGYMEYEKLCDELDRKTKEACEEFKRGMERLCNQDNPVPWDWSTTPPWVRLILKASSGFWYLCDGDVIMHDDHIDFGDSEFMAIPKKYAPKWFGDWKLSKTMRPKELAK